MERVMDTLTMKNEYWAYAAVGSAAALYVLYKRTKPRPLTEDEYEAVRRAPAANLEADPFPLSPRYVKPVTPDPLALEGYISESQPVYGAPYNPGRTTIVEPANLMLPVDYSRPLGRLNGVVNTPNDPTGSKQIETVKKGRQAVRIGTANIKNFPDMVPAKVQADARKMASLTTIWGGQEITPGEDSGPILAAMGPHWGILFGRRETPIFYRSDRWHVSDMFEIDSGDRAGIPLSPRNSAVTSAVFQSVARPGLPPFAVVNCHLMRHLRPREIQQWNVEYANLVQVVRHHTRQGRSVFVVGDTNNRLTQFPGKNGKWLVGNARIDKIGFVGVKESVRIVRTNGNPAGEIHALNSDHSGLVYDGELDG
jgi:hypothetical protein